MQRQFYTQSFQKINSSNKLEKLNSKFIVVDEKNQRAKNRLKIQRPRSLR